VRRKAETDFQKLRVQLSSESEARVRAETEKEELAQRLEDEKRLLAEARERLTDTFKALASTTEDGNMPCHLPRKPSIRVLRKRATSTEKKRSTGWSNLLTLTFDEHVRTLETIRQQAYTSLESDLKGLTESQEKLQKETANLVTALRTPQIRGRWGEMTLKRVVELAGMSEHCDFTEQLSVSTDEGRIRPDLIVHLLRTRNRG
jgi:DNA recombination protein RmuC